MSYIREVYKRTDSLWEWRLVAPNGQIIATSGGQGYGERNDAIEGFERVLLALTSPEPIVLK